MLRTKLEVDFDENLENVLNTVSMIDTIVAEYVEAERIIDKVKELDKGSCLSDTDEQTNFIKTAISEYREDESLC